MKRLSDYFFQVKLFYLNTCIKKLKSNFQLISLAKNENWNCTHIVIQYVAFFCFFYTYIIIYIRCGYNVVKCYEYRTIL